MTWITGTTADRERVDLQLAVELADAGSLREAITITLPAVAEVSGAAVVVFAVAGTAAAGARCWPDAPDWSAAFEADLAAVWESGPLTTFCQDAGVVPPFRIDALMRELGWTSLPLRAPGGELLRHAGYLAVSAVGSTVSGYFVARVDRELSDDELAALGRLQGALVASHGRFLQRPHPDARLTARQRQILLLLEGGLTAGAIASRLAISESTVGKHLRDLYARLDAHDRVSAIREARARRLLDGVEAEQWQDVRMP